jgi:hypothetical protein
MTIIAKKEWRISSKNKQNATERLYKKKYKGGTTEGV